MVTDAQGGWGNGYVVVMGMCVCGDEMADSVYVLVVVCEGRREGEGERGRALQ
jgi:hypothetical protein